MDVHILGWIGLAAIILTLIVIDIVGHVRTPHEPTMKEAAVWSVAYIGMALAFGGIVWFVWGGGFAQEYLAGYITEKALSIDNLFVFVIMMSSFKVPRKYQQEVLLAGIVIALVLRLIFILAGAALIENFSWVFYFFGAWLLWTAFSQAREGVQEPDDDDEEYRPSGFVKLVARVIPMTDGFVGGKVIHRHAGRTIDYSHELCIIAIRYRRCHVRRRLHPRDLLPDQRALPGLLRNAFSLLGLRQLYFLIRRAARPTRLPPLRPGGHPRLHRLQAHRSRPAHQRGPLHQRGPGVARHPRGVDRSVPERHHQHRPGHGHRLVLKSRADARGVEAAS